MDTSPGGYGELSSGAVALLNHLASRNIRVIGMGFLIQVLACWKLPLAHLIFEIRNTEWTT